MADAPAKEMVKGTTPSIVALRYLLEVVEAGSFSHAADRLRLTPSTLSRRVAELKINWDSDSLTGAIGRSRNTRWARGHKTD